MANHPIRRYTNEINYVPSRKPLVRRIAPAQAHILDQVRTVEGQIIEQGTLAKSGHSPLQPSLLPPIQPAFTAQETVRETTNGKERAVATVIRMAPMTGIFAILATGLAFALRLSWGQALVIFALITGVTYYRFNRTDYEHSAAGVERHRIDRATDLAKAKLAHDNQLRRELAQTYLQYLEQSKDD